MDANERIVSPNAITPQEGGQGEDYRPKEDVVKIVLELLQRSKRASSQLRKTIPDNYNFFIGNKHWSVDRPSWRFSEALPLGLGTMLQEVGIQTDSRPKVDFIPTDPTDVRFVQVLKDLNDRNWAKSAVQGFGWPNRLEEHIFEVKYSPWSFAEICWDPTLEPPLGDIGWKKLDPTYSYWDPLAKTMHECRWFIQLEPTPTELLKAKYPDKAAEIKPDVSELGTEESRINKDYNIDRQSLVNALENEEMSDSGKADNFGGEKMSLLIRCWVRDSAIEEVASEKDLTTEQRMKYPKGRYIEMVGKTVLLDGHNGCYVNGKCEPYEDGEFPIAILRNYSIPGKLHGISEAPFLRGPQKVVDYVWSFILDSMKMSSNPKVTLTPNAGELADEITNEPGAVFEVPTQDSIVFHSGEGVPASSMQILDQAVGLMDKSQGIQEVSRGASQPGVTSGLMMEGFVEAAQTRPRLKNRNVDQFLQQVGYLMLSRILQFYKAPRVFRLLNPQEGWPEHMEFFMGEDENGNRVANMTPIAQGKTGPVPGPTAQVPVKGMPDVIVQSGSALPYGRAQKQAMADNMFKLGTIDLETYLTDVGRTDVKQIMDRLQQQKAAEAAAMPPPGVK